MINKKLFGYGGCNMIGHRTFYPFLALILFAMSGCELYKQQVYKNDFTAEEMMMYDKNTNKTVVHVGDIEMIINQMKLLGNDSFSGFQQEYNNEASYHQIVKMLEHKKRVVVLNTEGDLSQFHIYLNHLDFQASGQIGFRLSNTIGFKTYHNALQVSDGLNKLVREGENAVVAGYAVGSIMVLILISTIDD